MATTALKRRDWSLLPSELLQEIAGNLTEIPDRVRFRCVCVPWRFAAESISRPPRQLPWLLLPLKLNPEATNFSSNADVDIKYKRRFWSFAENRIYELPPIDRASLTSSSCDVWTAEVRSMYSTPLPSWVPSLPNKYQDPPVCELKIFSSASPSPSSYDLIAAIVVPTYVLFCRAGESSWKEMKTPCYFTLRALALHDNRFFAFQVDRGVTSVFNIDTVQRTREIPAPEGYVPDHSHYLVQTPFGELLLVIRNSRDSRDDSKMFNLFRLDKMKFKWIKITSIGDNVLFMDDCQAVSFDARCLTSCKRNTIYFVDWCKKVIVLLFDVEKGRIEEAPIFEVEDRYPSAWPQGCWIPPPIS